MTHPWSIAGKTVLLTGVAGGIGTSAAVAFKEAGATVLGVDRNEKAEAPLDWHLVADLREPGLPDQIAERWPVVDVLVNNVGLGMSVSLGETTDEVLDSLLDINLRVTVRFCRRFAPEMGRRGHGKIINVASVLAKNPVPTVAAYSASKAAVIGFTRSIALEFAERNVQANVLAPGYIAVPKNAEYFASEAGRQFAERFMPTGKPGSPQSLGGPLLFLASAMSDHVTGHVLVADGGYSIW